MKAIWNSLGVAIAVVYAFMPGAAIGQQQKPGTVTTYQHFNRLTADASWRLVDSIPLNFTTYHTQGLTKVGAFYFLSAVKVIRWPKKYPALQNGYDRDNGEGVGYLFKFSEAGKLIDSVRLGEGVIYHPGGIDFDENHIWVPVCEYRPFGKSIVYRVDPNTLKAELVARIPDAIGAVAYNRETNELVGMNWGSRKFYKWKITHSNGATVANLRGEKGYINPHFYVDFQDCNDAGAGKMICSGLRTYKNAKGDVVRLGGLEMIDMNDFDAGLQLPVTEYTAKGVILTNNPFYVESVGEALQFYFVPEDDSSTLYIYRTE
ncbi:MAG: DUF6454 family protein [Agriterribacter sp.]